MESRIETWLRAGGSTVSLGLNLDCHLCMDCVILAKLLSFSESQLLSFSESDFQRIIMRADGKLSIHVSLLLLKIAM